MFDKFIEIVRSVDFEEFGTFLVNSVGGGENELTLSCQVTIDDETTFPRLWEIECSGVTQQSFRLGYFDDINFFRDHVLLIPFSNTIQRLGFRGKAKDPAAVVGALYQKHHEIVGDWIPFSEYFIGFELTDMIRGGFGTLAEGPATLIVGYDKVLRSHGLDTTISGDREPSYWNGKSYKPYGKLTVLVLDKSFVVAESFSVRSL